ncbi:ribonuclease H [Candidatus Woesearchaeota archaeon]|jgi:ribonuclease H-related protein|nr:ribonuclease H [Candidatus Woesearchaeota archaeon]
MAKKIYVVLKGHEPGTNIYKTWAECKEKVSGFPNALFKGFLTVSDAVKYVQTNSNATPAQIKLLFKKNGFDIIIDSTQTKSNSSSDSLVAYVDGSFSKSKNAYSYGIVLLKNNKVIKTLNGKGNDSEAAKMFQIYGELLGAIKAVEYAIKNKESSIKIYYDYAGIEHWATGSWNRNKIFTKSYHDFMSKSMKKISISFKKVLAHSGDTYNEMADQLAKEALK